MRLSKRIVFLLALSILSNLMALSQQMKVENFQMDLKDLSARRYPRKDLNGDNCALLKVLCVEKELVFEGSVVGNIENKTNEYWVYVAAGSKSLVIKHSDYLPLKIKFDDLGISSLLPSTTYRLTVLAEKEVEKDDGMSYFAMKVVPANAFVTINGEKGKLDDLGILMMKLKRGTYKYTVTASGYDKEEGNFTLGKTRKILNVRLSPSNPQNPDTEQVEKQRITVNDENKDKRLKIQGEVSLWHKNALTSYNAYVDLQQSNQDNYLNNSKLDSASVINRLTYILHCAFKSDSLEKEAVLQGYDTIKYHETNLKIASNVLKKLAYIGSVANNNHDYTSANIALMTYINAAKNSLFDHKTIVSDKDYQQILYVVALSSYFLKNYDIALEYAFKIIDDSNFHAQSMELIIEIYSKLISSQNDKNTIITKLQELRKKYPKEQALYEEIYVEMRRYSTNEDIGKWLEEEVERNPKNKEIWKAYGMFSKENGNYEKAIECFDNVVAIDSLDHFSVYILAYCSYLQSLVLVDKYNNSKGKVSVNFSAHTKSLIEKSINCYERLKSLDPEDKKYYWTKPLSALYQLRAQNYKAK